jgi:hypothetical protein
MEIFYSKRDEDLREESRRASPAGPMGVPCRPMENFRGINSDIIADLERLKEQPGRVSGVVFL